MNEERRSDFARKAEDRMIKLNLTKWEAAYQILEGGGYEFNLRTVAKIAVVMRSKKQIMSMRHA